MYLLVPMKRVNVLGISESFRKGVSEKSVLAGVIMRADTALTGFVVASVTVGGLDATDSVIAMYETLERDDIDLLMLNGCIISWYNVIDLQKVAQVIGLPLVCLTYKQSEGLEPYFKQFFPEDWKTRVTIYRKNKSRTPVKVHTGYTVYVRAIGITLNKMINILNEFTLHGAVPEPLRIARLLARSIATR